MLRTTAPGTRKGRGPQRGRETGIEHAPAFVPLDDDPDDYRPGSSWALSMDPDGRTRLAVVHERIAVGDRIPRHWHDVDEVVLYASGEATVHLDGADVPVAAGATCSFPPVSSTAP
jgi:quercetin dioxygenase-like cupin family protein